MPPKHINVTLGRNGKYFQASWYEPSGRRRRKSLGAIDETNQSGISRAKAEIECAKIEAQVNSTGVWTQRSNPTVKYIADDWLANRKGNISETTYQSYSKAVIPMMTRCIGVDTKASMVTPEDALRYRRKLQQEYKTNTAARHFRIAKSVFERARKQQFIQFNPFDLVDAPPDNVKVEYDYVPAAEFERLLGHEPRSDWRAYWAMLRYAGMRANEPLRMGWQHVSIDPPRLLVPGNKDGRVTTKKKPREIPLVPELMVHLLAYQGIAPDGPLLFPNINRVLVNRRWKRLLANARTTLDVTPQALRVSRENEWMQVFPSPEVASWLGHTVQTQIKNYHDPRSPVSQRTMDAAANATVTNVGTKTFVVREKVEE